MKQIYVCEKCGKQFENYDDAWHCEESHLAYYRAPRVRKTCGEGENAWEYDEETSASDFDEGKDIPKTLKVELSKDSWFSKTDNTIAIALYKLVKVESYTEYDSDGNVPPIEL